MADILIIDDNEQWREIITEAADGLYECDVASKLDEACDKIRNSDFNIVCLNYGFHTEYNGRKLLILLRDKRPDIPVVLITGAFVGNFINISSKLSDLQKNFKNIKAILIKGNENTDIIDELIKTFDRLSHIYENADKTILNTENLKTVSWLHISDLHFGCNKNEKDWTLLNRALLKDLEDHQVAGEKQAGHLAHTIFEPNFIIITGDIAYHGITEEYDEAENFIKDIWQITGLNKDNTLIVPGNHDVFRGAIGGDPGHDSIYKELGDDTRSKEEWRKELYKWWDHHWFNDYIEKKFGNYKGFIEKVSSVSHDPKLFFAHNFQISDYNLGFIGLNSALISCKDGEDSNRNLWIGRQQIDELKDQTANALLRIAMVHHPKEALHMHDGAWGIIQNYCHIILHGHMHDLKAVTSGEPEKEHICLPGGSVNEGGIWKKQRYSYGEVNLEKMELDLYMRMTTVSGDTPIYIRDSETYPVAAPNGYLNIPLPEKTQIY